MSTARLVLAWVAASLCLAALVFGLPVLSALGQDHLGARPLAAGLLVLGLSTLALPRVGGVTPPRGVRALLLLPMIGTLVTDDPRWLRLAPSLVHAFVAWLFARSLGEEQSLIERGARLLEPLAPPFIADYCRGVSAVWAGVSIVNAATIAGLAILGPPELWAVFAGGLVWLGMAALSGLEYFVRKAWFRYYKPEFWIDRVWARLLPAERTPAGRRSIAYSRELRARGYTPSGLRALIRRRGRPAEPAPEDSGPVLDS